LVVRPPGGCCCCCWLLLAPEVESQRSCPIAGVPARHNGSTITVAGFSCKASTVQLRWLVLLQATTHM
jgi:hypothetical protein